VRFPATLSGFERAAEELRRVLDERRLDGRVRYNVELAFEEISMNIIRHGSPRADIDVAVAFDDGAVVLTFKDDGVPFDSRHYPDPVVPSSLAEAPIGGLGLKMVRRVSSRIDYERTAELNHLSVTIPAS
jgi:serine/threonine-protein kinase RsbW